MNLNNTKIAAILKNEKPGRYSDGRGLYLVKTPTGTGNWVMLYRFNNKVREMGLGSFSGASIAKTSLEMARHKADAIRVQLATPGFDPLAAKKRNALSASFRSMMEAKIASKMTGWGRTAVKNQKDWTSTLSNHAAPLMDLSVAKIDTTKVVEVLSKIWTTKIETADRVRERIAQVLDFAKDKGLREGDNPAAKDTVTNLLGAQKAAGAKTESHVAMARGELRTFWTALKGIEGFAARALELIVLTGARMGEVRGMVWSEVDLDAAKWTIPANRMKAGEEHVVMLSDQAVELLHAMPRREGTDIVFWGDTGEALSPVTIRRVLRSMYTEEQADVHGFRSAFVSWVHAETSFGRDLADEAIAHAVGTQVSRVYQKGKPLAKLAAMLQAWADYLDGKSNVVRLAA